MRNDYNRALDAAILAAIGDRRCTSHWISGEKEIALLHGSSDRPAVRKSVQGRLQSLRKRGKVECWGTIWKRAP